MSEDEESNRLLTIGKESAQYETDNAVTTAKYTLLNFLPIAIKEQFTRVGNIYFLVLGLLMAIGYYGEYFESAFSPWSVLFPLACVVAVSVIQEGIADIKRHNADARTNEQPCIVIKREEECINPIEGSEVEAKTDQVPDIDSYDMETRLLVEESCQVKICQDSVPRSEIYAGNLVLIKNREMVPADVVLLASSSEQGNAYIETSSIDGETNLKLRTTPDLDSTGSPHKAPLVETLEMAVQRLAHMTVLGHPHGMPAVDNPINAASPQTAIDIPPTDTNAKHTGILQKIQHYFSSSKTSEAALDTTPQDKNHYVAMLISEPPNPSVNTFIGQLILPPPLLEKPSIVVPLSAD